MDENTVITLSADEYIKLREQIYFLYGYADSITGPAQKKSIRAAIDEIDRLTNCMKEEVIHD